MMSGQSDSGLQGLQISLVQKQDASTPTIIVKVSNFNTSRVSILSYNSPLDPLALQLGLLHITPAGASEPLDLPRIQLRRVWPPTAEHLISIEPGQIATSEVELKSIMVNPDDLGPNPTIQLKGWWQAVWTRGKDEVHKESLENPQHAADAFHGEFLSEPLQMIIP
jgi:hypothetical protein